MASFAKRSRPLGWSWTSVTCFNSTELMAHSLEYRFIYKLYYYIDLGIF